MKVLMLTNTYPPVVSGVARSVVAFEDEYRRLGHEVLVIAPETDGPSADARADDTAVVRIPAIQHFNGSDFPMPVPSPGLVLATVEEFKPDVVHAHHPFFMGSTAMRVARARNLPLVFTHHTMWDQYTHYASADSPMASRFIGTLVAGYANLCDAVIAPSQSVADLLRERGVQTRIEILPTGVDVAKFAHGDGARLRGEHGIPAEALVAGYVGRLAPEKNLRFLATAVAEFMKQEPAAHFLVVGSGPSGDEIQQILTEAGVADRLHLTGICEGEDLIDAYHALDVFVFASHSETQGMVLTEAMATGAPVVALDGPGVRDVLEDGVNGRLIVEEDVARFAEGLKLVLAQGARRGSPLSEAARHTAEQFSMPRQAKKALQLYESLLSQARRQDEDDYSTWSYARRRIEAEWELWSNVAHAASCALEPDGQVMALQR